LPILTRILKNNLVVKILTQDYIKYTKDESSNLKVDDPERHRLTGGVTLSLGKKSLQADIRLNYEQYFYNKGVTPAISEQNKIVMEFVAHF